MCVNSKYKKKMNLNVNLSTTITIMTDINEEWDSFIYNRDISSDDVVEKEEHIRNLVVNPVPKSNNIYISTKTKIAHLTSAINLDMFWKIPIIKYSVPTEGVIKKQIKINSTTPEEVEVILDKLKYEEYFEEYILSQKQSGKTPFKDVRRISIGISKKDILITRSKKKSAFYNCFVLLVRILGNNKQFKEYHVKVFNTGKLEIPGIQDESIFQRLLTRVEQILTTYNDISISIKNDYETVLINSNFNCGYYINRESLTDVLKYNYNIDTMYDPCSYPGIQCKYYHKDGIEPEVKVSFMVFRTGSVLIVGKCNECVLYIVYEFLKALFEKEYDTIHQHGTIDVVHKSDKNTKEPKKVKSRFITTLF